jgi:hypothetical protein
VTLFMCMHVYVFVWGVVTVAVLLFLVAGLAAGMPLASKMFAAVLHILLQVRYAVGSRMKQFCHCALDLSPDCRLCSGCNLHTGGQVGCSCLRIQVQLQVASRLQECCC